MTFQEAFKEIREHFMQADVSRINEKIAVQINLTGEGEGIFYAEIKDGYLSVEPYDYHDRDLLFIVDTKDFIKIASGKMSAEKAFLTKKLIIEGDLDKAMKINEILKQQ
ncbi:MAG: SCP2 sterol-binding domain-containing protein [Oscillospiraceae bacterium]|nr:SCP2 sterol-binding domain-containing protein [Oscillospiraceae bacterium]